MSDFGNPMIINWLSTLIVTIGVALIVSSALAAWSGRLLKLAPEHKLWAFIIGFAFLSSLATAPMVANYSWSAAIYFCALPLILILIYFLPTVAAIIARNPAFQAIFILNLFFGWTVIAWLVALGWAVRRAQPDPRPAYRITPFGAVPARPEAGGSRRPA